MFEIKWPISFVLLILTSQCLPVENVCPPCECGRINRNGKVLGEGDVQINEFPWIARIYYNSSHTHVCTGSLINSKYILTTAYCASVYSKNTDNWRVHLLGHNVDPKAGESSLITRKVKRVILHDEYKDVPKKYADIALVQLDRNVEFSNVLVPTCLPRSDFNVNGSTAVFVCLGDQTASKKVPFTINNYDNCTKPAYFEVPAYAQDDKLCTEYPENMWCKKQYGDALHLRYNDTGAYYIAGINSYDAILNGKHNAPPVFTKVSHFLEWISNNTQDACSCHAVDESMPSHAIGEHQTSIEYPSYRHLSKVRPGFM